MYDLLVSFPHYFLQAVGHLAEQLKTREWIVARITSITERVVDQNVCHPIFVLVFDLDVQICCPGSKQ